jgi:hypothetical protein
LNQTRSAALICSLSRISSTSPTGTRGGSTAAGQAGRGVRTFPVGRFTVRPYSWRSQ